jgi:hypothetical protein
MTALDMKRFRDFTVRVSLSNPWDGIRLATQYTFGDVQPFEDWVRFQTPESHVQKRKISFGRPLTRLHKFWSGCPGERNC